MRRPAFIFLLIILETLAAGFSDCRAADETDAAAEATKTEVAQKKDDAEVLTNPFPDAVLVPPGIMDGGTEWLNTSAPIDLKELRGKVVILDFWTYCCINCIHVLPDLKFLEQKYEKELVVIGVHSAKFDNEKLSDNIREAILRYEIRHPVVNDSEMLIWQKFGTRAWPTLALIDPEGKFIGAQGGEGNRQLFDTIIARLVKYHRAKGTLNEDPIVFDLEQNRASVTPLRYPGKVLGDAASNRIFISDSNHNRIVITDLQGQFLSTIGTGQIGRSDGAFDVAEFDHPQGMELVGDVLYVADTENHLLRAVDLTARTVSTLAGTGQQGQPRGEVDRLEVTSLNSPWALCHIDGVLYIAMAGPHQIWSHKLGTKVIRVHAGNGREDVIDGSLEDSSFAQPSGITPAPDGKFFFVADSEGSSIRKVPVLDRDKVSTLAGTSELPRGGSLFAFGDIDNTGQAARFQHPLGVAWHDGSVYVADTYNHKIRRINAETGEVTTWLGDGTSGDSLSPVRFSEPSGLSVADEKLYIADTNNHRILIADLKTKDVSELTLDGVRPPTPQKTRRVPDMANATTLPEQTVAVSDELDVVVDLAVSEGYKLNTLAPITWEVFVIEGDQILAPTALQGRNTASADGGTATFSLPLTKTPGTAMIAIEISFGYCDSESENICRLANQLWKFPLTVSADTPGHELKLAFSKPKVRPVLTPEPLTPKPEATEQKAADEPQTAEPKATTDE
ncbi:MAG: thioredoxin-like domain-containing protein [Planctomycetaceae bacterium]